MKFGVISDTHHHNWSAFSKSASDAAVNSRLQIILDETLRAARTMKEAGCEALIHCGDMFHVRGSVAPSVLNPTLRVYDEITKSIGLQVLAISGNHDLEGKESSHLGSAMSALREVGVCVINQEMEQRFGADRSGVALFVPWQSSVDRLKMLLEDQASRYGSDAVNTTLIIHAPVNGVIMGIPDHGLDHEYLGDLGFKQVFCGHYHNHRDFGNGVYSVGALTHQTWGDVGTRAGFLIVDDADVTYHASHAPQFIDLNPAWDADDVPLHVDGNYVRAKIEVESQREVEELREWLLSCGAAGVVIHPIKNLAATTRTGSTTKSGQTVAGSITDFIKTHSYTDAGEVEKGALSVLAEIEGAA